MWSVLTDYKPHAARMLVVFLASGIIAVFCSEMARAIGDRETHLESQQGPEQKPPSPPPVMQRSQGASSPNTTITGNNNVVGNNNTVNSTDPRVLARLDEIKGLLEKRPGDRLTPDSLSKKYPLGYVIFDVDSSKSVLPYRNEMLQQWNFDWSVVQIHDETQDGFWLRIPDMRSKIGHGFVLNYNVRVPKKVGPFPQTIIRQGTADLKGEILAINDKGIVFLLGFVDNTPKP